MGYPDGPARQRVFAAIQSVTVGRDRLQVSLVRDALDDPDLDAEAPILRIPVRLSRSQSVQLIHAEGTAPAFRPKVDRILVRAVVLARAWAKELEAGTSTSIGALARRQGLCEHYTARLLPLAYLAPDLVQQILDGRQPHGMTIKRLTAAPLPPDWVDQRRFFAAAV